LLESVRRIAITKALFALRADYLAYTLIDAIDGFFPVLAYGERIEDLEAEVVANPTPDVTKKSTTPDGIAVPTPRHLAPTDAINCLLRDASELISDDVRVHLRDCYDHAVQVIDMVETYREHLG